MAVSILLNQAGKPPGVAAQAREDFDLVTPISIQAVGGPFAQLVWTIADRPVDYVGGVFATDVVAAPSSASTSITGHNVAGTRLLKVAVDAGFGLGARAEDNASITFYAGPALGAYGSLPVRIPAFGEKREHNVPRPWAPNGNQRGWKEALDYWVAAFSTGAIAAPFIFRLDGVYDGAIVPGSFDPPLLVRTSRTIVEVALFRRTAGSAGTTRCDVKKNGVSIFSGAGAMPQVAFGAGDEASSVVSAFNLGAAACLPGDYLDVTLESVESFLPGPPQGPEGLSVMIRFG